MASHMGIIDFWKLFLVHLVLVFASLVSHNHYRSIAKNSKTSSVGNRSLSSVFVLITQPYSTFSSLFFITPFSLFVLCGFSSTQFSGKNLFQNTYSWHSAHVFFGISWNLCRPSERNLFPKIRFPRKNFANAIHARRQNF